MVSQMQKVSSMVSSKLGDTLSNIKNWGGLFYNAGEYGIVSGVDVTDKLQELVNLANSAGRSTIVFPEAAEYIVTSIENDGNIVYFGDGASFTGGYGRIINSFADYLNITEQLAEIANNVKTYGAVGDGVTDDTAAFVSALAAGDEVIIPEPTAFYRVTATITPGSGKRLVGNGDFPEIKLDSTIASVLFDLDDSEGVIIENLTLNGNKSVTPSDKFISMNNSKNCTIRECIINDAPGSIYGSIELSGEAQDNLIENNDINASEGTAISLSGDVVQRNTINLNRIMNSGMFGIRLGEGANRNEITRNRTTSNGIELIGITSVCHLNRIAFNHAEGCGDNGISVTGYDNTVIGNVCRNNYGGGIWLWGSFNTVVGNICLNNNQSNNGNNWAGIGVSANYGGCGQFNTIIGNICDDDQLSPTQWNGVRIAGSAYVQWATGQSIAQGQYRYNGLNVYYAVNSGTTGATAPTHTTGEVSDGGVIWRYMRSFLNTVGSRYNVVADNNVIRFQSGDYVDVADNWAFNTLISRAKVDNRATGEYRIGAGASSAVLFNIGGTDKVRVTANEFRPEADLNVNLGLSNRQWTGVYAGAYYVAANRVLTARQTGWAAATGTATRTTFATSTVTTAQLAERVKALIDDLIAHGLIGS